MLTALTACGAKPPLSLDVTAAMLAHGVGSIMIHKDSEWTKNHITEIKRSANLIMGLPFEWADIMFPEEPEGEKDIQGIVNLAESMKE